MVAVNWTRHASPFEVTFARATGDASVIAVGTTGGHVHLRRRDGTGWRWEHAGAPPGTARVIDGALLAAAEPGGDVPALVGDDVRVWLHRPDAAPTPWIGLDGPGPDVGKPRIVDPGRIVACTMRDGAQFQHTLMVCSSTGRPWVLQGIGPDAAWRRTDADWVAVEFAAALASVDTGAEPRHHAFSLTVGSGLFEVPVLRVAVHDGSGWTWVDPPAPPSGAAQIRSLSATGFLDGGGRALACAAVIVTDPDTFADNAMVVVGSGRDWRWIDLGQPTATAPLAAAVVVVKGPDGRPGDEPVVVGLADNIVWTRSLTGDWTELGTPPQGVGIGNVPAAFETAAGTGPRRVWSVALSQDSQDSELWTFASGEGGLQWEKHDRPGSMASIVGAYSISRDPVLEGKVVAHVIDQDGEVWGCELRGKPSDTFSSGGIWTHHGPPAPGVTAAAGAGMLALGGLDPEPAWSFVVGSDGHLWARTTGGTGWTWVDHGAPEHTSVRSAAAPISAELPGGQPTVFALADDGRLWMRSAGEDAPGWTDLGMPEGQLIFALVGAECPPTEAGLLPAAFVVTGDGHLWVKDFEDGMFTWTDLGTPAPTEKIVAGIGVGIGPDPEQDSSTLEVAVLSGSPSGQVWSLRWERGFPPRWTAHGRPGDARVRAGVGAITDPRARAGCLIAVLGNDRQIWVTSSATSVPWTRWDPWPAGTTTVDGLAAELLNLPCALVLNDTGRLTIATPRQV
ncbi:MAG TPA: hypothetical protein VFV01_49200 [Spirillospora sp.]|nr:hypothetical protein [Spirillospora sp.]